MEASSSRAGLRLVSVHLPEKFVEGIEALVTAKFYANRSEAIRIAVRDLLKAELWGNAEK